MANDKLRNFTVINLGIKDFIYSIKTKQIIDVDWKPPAPRNSEIYESLVKIAHYEAQIDKANQEAFNRITKGEAKLIEVGRAIDLIPGMRKDLFLHAGPPIEWERMCGPMKGAILGGAIYEGLANDFDELEELIKQGKLNFEPCHHYNAVGPMTGILTPSMPVFRIYNSTYDISSYCSMNEGLGKVLRFGAYSEEVIERLRWMRDYLAPVLKEAINLAPPIDLKQIIAEMLMMGDEGHNRNKAGTSLFFRKIAPYVVLTNFSNDIKSQVLKFIDSNDHFFLNLSMATCKALLKPIEGIPYCSIISIMSRNGVEFGIQVASLNGKWFTAPAPKVKGLYFPGFTERDANPDLGDSVITETLGIGGFSMATAPAIVQFVGGNPQEALSYTTKMYEITHKENPKFKIPLLNFKGIPTGIDLRLVVETKIEPIINTGIAHKEPGIGQIGAGIVRAPIECFHKAVVDFANHLN